MISSLEIFQALTCSRVHPIFQMLRRWPLFQPLPTVMNIKNFILLSLSTFEPYFFIATHERHGKLVWFSLFTPSKSFHPNRLVKYEATTRSGKMFSVSSPCTLQICNCKLSYGPWNCFNTSVRSRKRAYYIFLWATIWLQSSDDWQGGRLLYSSKPIMIVFGAVNVRFW